MLRLVLSCSSLPVVQYTGYSSVWVPWLWCKLVYVALVVIVAVEVAFPQDRTSAGAFKYYELIN